MEEPINGEKRMRRNDIILIAILLLISIVVFTFYHYVDRKQGNQVVITVNGKEYAILPLIKNTRFEIKSGDNLNILEIKDGYAKMIEASCPDLICVHQGKISYSGESIICLPNKVVVRVVGDEDNTVDAVAK